MTTSLSTNNNRTRTHTLWSAGVGPYSSPYEQYAYSSLPFCHYSLDATAAGKKRDRPYDYWEPLAEWTLGHDERFSGEFQCETEALTKTQVDQFHMAVRQQWSHRFFLEDFPTWGLTGKLNTAGDIELYTKANLQVHVNPDGKIVRVDFLTDARMSHVQVGKKLHYQMSVTYEIDKANAMNPLDYYLDLNSQVRTISVPNSCAIAFFLVVMGASYIWKISKHNNNKGSGRGSEDTQSATDTEMGEIEFTSALQPLLLQEQQKTPVSVSLDPKEVFTPPTHVGRLAILLGNGWHLFAWISLMTISMNGVHPIEYGPAGRWEVLWKGYTGTSIVGGYMSSFYLQQQQQQQKVSLQESWQRIMIWTALLLPVFVVIVHLVMSTIYKVAVIAYPPPVDIKMLPLVSLETFRKFLLLWVFIAIPSHIMGTFLGRWHQSKCGHPIDSFLVLSMPGLWAHTKNEIELKWKRMVSKAMKTTQSAMLFSALFGGMLTFSGMYIELHFCMESLWNHKFYVVTCLIIVELVVVFLVSSATGVFCTVLLLNRQDSSAKTSWQWNGFFTCASTGGYFIVYSISYFVNRSRLEGLYTTLHYFGTMLVLSMMAALICGAISHFAAYRCVRLLYSNIKAA